MKKLLALVLAVMMVASMAVVASAESTTTLTTTVPAATYTLNIPADQEIEFGADNTNIGSLYITDATGFAEGKNLEVTITYDAFKSNTVATTIPFAIDLIYDNANTVGNITSGSAVTFWGQENGSTCKYARETSYGKDLENFFIVMDSADWGKALAGEYTATITFTAEVVVE